MTVDLTLIKTLVEAAQHAPSGDNCQPLRYVWNSPVLEIYDCPDRGHGFVNKENFGTWASLGAALKNMDLVAASRGIKIKRTLFPSGEKMAALRFEKMPPRSEPLVNFIPIRTVNRDRYYPAKISAEARRALKDVVSGHVQMDLIEPGDAFNTLVDGVVLGEVCCIFEKRIHSYLFSWVRWTRAAVLKTKDGMPIQSLAFNFSEMIGMWLMRFWGWLRFMSMFGGQRLFMAMRRNVFRHTAAYGVLSVKKWTPETLIETGENIQEMWLKATSLNLAFHGIMGYPMMIQIDRGSEGSPFPKDRSEKLRKNVEELKKLIPSLQNRELSFLFRIGEARPPRARALRRPVDAVLEIKK